MLLLAGFLQCDPDHLVTYLKFMKFLKNVGRKDSKTADENQAKRISTKCNLISLQLRGWPLVYDPSERESSVSFSSFMSRDEFGGLPSYGTLSSGNVAVGYGRPSRYQDGGGDRFQELADTVSSKIFQINNNTAALDRALKQLIGGKDGQEEKLHRIQVATNNLATTTTEHLKEMSSLCGGSSPSARQQRVQQDRLKGEFRESISRYYSVQNKVVEKEKLLVGSTRPAQRQDSGRYQDDFGNENTLLLEDDQRRQEREQMGMQIDLDESLIREREERLRQIEGDILDINEIFRDLAAMVYEQGDMVDSIEANVERAHTNVEGANLQLSKASLYQKKARTKLCILLIILLFVAGAIALIVELAKSH